MQSIDEIWKPVPGYEGLYEVSTSGRVKACARTVVGRNQSSEFKRYYPEKILAFHYLEHGYTQVYLNKDGHSKGFLVHRLVAQVFIPNPENKPEVNHKDRNAKNNSLTNLEWVTKQENIDHALDNGWNPHLSRLGKKNSEYHNKRISETHRNKVYTDEGIRKLQTSHKKQSKKCRCIETGQIFISFAEAGRCLGLDSTNISDSIRQHRSVKGRYTFELV